MPWQLKKWKQQIRLFSLRKILLKYFSHQHYLLVYLDILCTFILSLNVSLSLFQMPLDYKTSDFFVLLMLSSLISSFLFCFFYFGFSFYLLFFFVLFFFVLFFISFNVDQMNVLVKENIYKREYFHMSSSAARGNPSVTILEFLSDSKESSD